MPPAFPLSVQGHAYSYRDIKCLGLPGLERIKPYLRSVDFSNTVAADHAHGAGQLSYGKVSGAYAPTCEIELAEEGLDILLPLLPAQGYSDFPFDWMLLFAKAQTIPPFHRISFKKFFVLGDRGSWSQGTTPLSVRIPCHVTAIERDLGDGVLRCPINLIAELSGL
jgi:hypothetical protein